MDSTIFYVVILSLCLGAAYLWACARAGARFLPAFAESQEGFFKAAGVLIDDERTPDIIVEYLERMAPKIRETDSARHILWNLLTGRAKRWHRNPPEDFKRFREAAESLPPELAGWLGGAAISYAFAVTYRSVVAGWVLRNILLFQLQPKSRDQYRDTNALEKVEPVLSDLSPHEQLCAA